MGFGWQVAEKRERDYKVVKIDRNQLRTFFDFCGLFQVEKNRRLGTFR